MQCKANRQTRIGKFSSRLHFLAALLFAIACCNHYAVALCTQAGEIERERNAVEEEEKEEINWSGSNSYLSIDFVRMAVSRPLEGLAPFLACNLRGNELLRLKLP